MVKWNWKGGFGLSVVRWRFWRERFGWVAGLEDVREDTRGYAREAVEAMGGVEGQERAS